MRAFIFLCFLSAFFACKSPVDNGKQVQDAKSPDTTGVIAANLADSFDIVYYKKPFNDPERYARFFRVAHVRDTLLRGDIEKLLRLPGVKEDSVRKCMSEGKIILPLKGDAFRVVYFAREQKPCSYLYLIKDGSFYYYELTSQLKDRLDQFEREAKEPQSSGS